MRADEVAELVAYLTDEERVELDQLLAADRAIWRPLPGPQSAAYHSAADIIGFGGSAGGGKTDLACGKALTQHADVMILRRVGTELTAIEDRLEGLIGDRRGYNGTTKIWRTRRRDGQRLQIELGAVQHPGDEKKFQGRPHDLLVFDEAVNFLEHQVRFLLTWLRTTKAAQKCQALLTFNPPQDAEGRWIVAFFAPWLDTNHPNPALPGELRWFGTVDGRDYEVADGRPFVLVDDVPSYDFERADHAAEDVITPLSRTFIPSRVTDNPYLMGTGYMAMLQGLPEPLRSQMLKGDFMAGVEDDKWQVIPTAWVDAAQARWAARTAKGPMDSMGVDVARGGKDETVIYRRHGTWFDEAVALPGAQTPDGPSAAAQVIAYRRDRAPVHVDVIGFGSSCYDFLVANDIQSVAVNNAAKTQERDAKANVAFYNVRARDYWRMREALDPTNPDPVALPPHPQLKADLTAPRYKLTPGGYLVEPKEDVVERLGRSPDHGDACVMALRATAKDGDTAERRPSGGGRNWMSA